MTIRSASPPMEVPAGVRRWEDYFLCLPFPPYCPLDGWIGDLLHLDQHGEVHIALRIFDESVKVGWSEADYCIIETALRAAPASTPDLVASLMELIRQ